MKKPNNNNENMVRKSILGDEDYSGSNYQKAFDNAHTEFINGLEGLKSQYDKMEKTGRFGNPYTQLKAKLENVHTKFIEFDEGVPKDYKGFNPDSYIQLKQRLLRINTDGLYKFVEDVRKDLNKHRYVKDLETKVFDPLLSSIGTITGKNHITRVIDDFKEDYIRLKIGFDMAQISARGYIEDSPNMPECQQLGKSLDNVYVATLEHYKLLSNVHTGNIREDDPDLEKTREDLRIKLQLFSNDVVRLNTITSKNGQLPDLTIACYMPLIESLSELTGHPEKLNRLYGDM